MYKKGIYVFILVFCIACEKPFDYTPSLTNNNILVVDALITNEFKEQIIYLSRVNNSPNDSFPVVSGASVIIYTSNNTYVFNEDVNNPGAYVSEQEFGAVVDKTYFLEISVNGKIYEASSTMEPLFLSDTLSVEPYGNGGYYYVKPPPEFHASDAAMFEINIIYPDTAQYSNSRFYFYVLNSFDISQLMSDNITPVIFTSGVEIIQRKYSLTKDHQKFIRSMLLETTWRGNAFDVESANVYTNISNDAVGLFAVSTVREIRYSF